MIGGVGVGASFRFDERWGRGDICVICHRGHGQIQEKTRVLYRKNIFCMRAVDLHAANTRQQEFLAHCAKSSTTQSSPQCLPKDQRRSIGGPRPQTFP